MQREDLAAVPLADLARLDDAAFRARFSGTPIKRTGRDRFVRNVLIAIGNSGSRDLAEEAARLLDDPSPVVRAMAVWAVARLLPSANVAALAAGRLESEHDPDVRAEWRQALSSHAAVENYLMNLFVFGLGYSAQALIRSRAWTRVAGTVRTRDKAGRMRAEGVAAYSLDEEASLADEIAQADAILISTPPAEGGDPTYCAVSARPSRQRAAGTWLGYLSTTGVYGDQAGGWVDETVPPEPRSARSARRVRGRASLARTRRAGRD